jgi:hypothetical protein
MSFHLISILEDVTASWTKWLPLIGGTLGAIGLFLEIIGKLRPFLEALRRRVLRPLWKGPVKPITKLVVATASLLIPNGFLIGFLTFNVASYYFEAGSVDYIVTNPAVFWQLLAWQTALVSLYSFLWAILLYPKLKTWFVFWKQASLKKGKTV